MPPAPGFQSDYCPLILRWEWGRKNDGESCVEWLIDSIFMPGEETALLPCQHNRGLHRYVPGDFRGKIMNMLYLEEPKQKESIVMGVLKSTFK